MKIGTSGFRGIYCDNFTKENVQKICQCISNMIFENNYKKEVIIGYDNRFMSETFAKWCCEVFGANKIKSLITQTSVPSPLVSLATKHKKVDFAVMITASHNPYFYNGLKVYVKDGKEPEKWQEEILNNYKKDIKEVKLENFENLVNKRLVEVFDFSSEYVKNIVSLLSFRKFKNTKAVYNVFNGSSLVAVKELKRQLKLEKLDIVNTNRDVSFNFDAPIPNEDKLQDFKEFALENKYDIAFATDGDGDRIAVFDENGKFYNGNELATLLYYFAIKYKNQKGAFIKNYSFSTIVDKLASLFKTEVVETKVGFKYITEGMENNNALFGAENSGCEVKGHAFVKDGLVVFALLLEIIEYLNKPLSQIVQEMKKEISYNMEYCEYSFSVKDKQKIIEYLNKKTPKFKKKIVEVGKLDGFKYIFEDGSWLLIRFSGTENLLRIVVEEYSKKALKDLIDNTIELVKNI